MHPLDLKLERLRPPAFFAAKAALFGNGSDIFLKAHEAEEHGNLPVAPTNGQDDRVLWELKDLRSDIKEGFQGLHTRFDDMLDRIDASFGRLISNSLQRHDLLDVLESYQASVEKARRGDVNQSDDCAQHLRQQYAGLGLVPIERLTKQTRDLDKFSQRILEAIEDVKNAVQEKGSILETMVESVVHADNEIPCTALLLPQALARRLRDNFAGKPVSRWRRFKREFSTKTSPLSKPLYLYFFCPVTGHIMPSNGGRGFELFVPREWFSSVSPYLKPLSALLNISIFVVGTALGLTAIASSVCRFLELPDVVPGNEDFFATLERGVDQGERFQQHLESMPDEAAKNRAAAVGTRSRDLILDNPRAMKGDNYGRMVEMLNHLGVTVSLGRCQRSKAACATPCPR